MAPKRTARSVGNSKEGPSQLSFPFVEQGTTQPSAPEIPPSAPLIERNLFSARQPVPSRRIPPRTDEEIADMWWNK